MIYKPSHPPQWQKYQASLKKAARRRHFFKRIPPLFLITGLAVTVVVMLVFVGIWLSGPARQDLKSAINGLAQDSAKLAEPIILNSDGRRYFIRTAIHPKLQKFILRTLKRSRTQQSAVVVMDPHDGRLLSMVNYDTNGHSANLCLQADFPAASLFKIVTAAAALESAGLTLDQSLYEKGSLDHPNQIQKSLCAVE